MELRVTGGLCVGAGVLMESGRGLEGAGAALVIEEGATLAITGSGSAGLRLRDENSAEVAGTLHIDGQDAGTGNLPGLLLEKSRLEVTSGDVSLSGIARGRCLALHESAAAVSALAATGCKGLEVLGGPEDGLLLAPSPGDCVGRAASRGEARFPLYRESLLSDERLSRRHLEWPGPRPRPPRAAAQAAGRGAVLPGGRGAGGHRRRRSPADPRHPAARRRPYSPVPRMR